MTVAQMSLFPQSEDTQLALWDDEDEYCRHCVVVRLAYPDDVYCAGCTEDICTTLYNRF